MEKLIAYEGVDIAYLGLGVSLGGETALFGAYGDDDNGDDSGSAYVFVREATTWTQQAKLSASGGWEGDRFGIAVSLSDEDDMALVGAELADLGSARMDRGSAYVFKRAAGTSWSPEGKLTASDGAQDDHFGNAVSLDGRVALVGAWGDDDDGGGSGSAYLFTWGGQNGDSCVDADECASSHCQDGACCDQACDGLCEACTAAKTGGANGICAPVLHGQDPDDECGLGAEQSCDGDRACKKHDAETCDAADECLSSYCANGMCCDKPCEGICEACTEALKQQGYDGKCGVVAAGSDPDDDCPSDPNDPCGSDGECDGYGDCRSFAPEYTVCEAQSCEDGVVTLASRCDGEGNCLETGTVPCEPYVCDVDACMTSCSEDADCIDGYACQTASATCVAMPICHDYFIVRADGSYSDCSPHRCTDDGECARPCQSTADCVDGYTCDSNGDCVEADALGAAESDSGCGCAVPGRTPGHASTLLLVWLASCCAIRRSRRPRA